MQKQASLNGVCTCYDDSMLVCPNKFFVEYFLPLAMEQLLMTVCKESVTGLLVLEMIENKIFEIVGELTEMSVANHLPMQR